jgi:hypothetical protein
MSACAIARMLTIADKAVTKALRHYKSGPKGTEPSAEGSQDNRLRTFMSPMGLRWRRLRSRWRLEVFELLVDPAEKEIPLLAILSLSAALLFSGLIGSHALVGRVDPEIDVVDPARHEGFLGLEEEVALTVEYGALGIALRVTGVASLNE